MNGQFMMADHEKMYSLRQNKTERPPTSESVRTAELMKDINEPLFGVGICREKPLTDTGKMVQLLKMFCLTVLPILGLWGFSVFILRDTIFKKTENEKTKQELLLSVELGDLIHRLQQERDMSVLYLSALGPETKTFLLQEYIGTDNAVDKLSEWPSNLDTMKRTEFESKDSLREYITRHRQLLTKAKYDLQDEIDFYTNIIQVVITWLYKSITNSKNAEVWKTLVSYLKRTSGKQDVGIERALGTLFYVQGGWESTKYFEMYNNVVHTFTAFYTTAELYSSRHERLYTSGINEVGGDLVGIINQFRYEIQHHEEKLESPNISKARYWFDNMTLYLDTLLEIQQDLGYEIIGKVDEVILDYNRELALSATFLVIVLIMCPLVIIGTENLTSSIQKHALALISQTKELATEQKKTKTMMYQVFPKYVVDNIGVSKTFDAEYSKSATILYVSISNIDQIANKFNPTVVQETLNSVCATIDSLAQKYDIFKQDTTRGRFIIISGIPVRNDGKHVTEIADFALDLLRFTKREYETDPNNVDVQMKMGVHTGPCVAGIVGTDSPRYYMFGNSVGQAESRMETSKPGQISISCTTYTKLQKNDRYRIRKSGYGKDSSKKKRNYWLYASDVDMQSGNKSTESEDDDDDDNKMSDSSEMPGEISQYNDVYTHHTLTAHIPGRVSITTKRSCSSSSEKRNVVDEAQATKAEVRDVTIIEGGECEGDVDETRKYQKDNETVTTDPSLTTGDVLEERQETIGAAADDLEEAKTD